MKIVQIDKENWADGLEKLSETYEVRQYAFGERVREGIDFAYEDKISDISEMMQSVYDNYSGQNLTDHSSRTPWVSVSALGIKFRLQLLRYVFTSNSLC